MSKLIIEKYLQSLYIEEGVEDMLRAYGKNIAKKQGGRRKTGPRKPPQYEKRLAAVMKLKAKQCPSRKTPELKQKCIKYYDAMISRIKANMKT